MGKRPYYKKHGLKSLMARVSMKGLVAIDKRSAGARALLAWRAELEADLGGTESLSMQKRTLVELACRLRLYLDHIDGWLMDQPSLVLKRKRTLLPVVRERMALSDSLGRLLKELGLERQAKHVGTLREYLEERASKGGNDEGDADDSGRDAGPETFGKNVPGKVGEGHVGDVEDISRRVVRVGDDGRAADGVREIHGKG